MSVGDVLASVTGRVREFGGAARRRLGQLRGGNGDDRRELADPDRRQVLRRVGTTAAAATAVTAASDTAAAVGNTCSIDRIDDRYLPWDAGGNYGGWRATEFFGVDGGSVSNPPVVFIHGNGGDACNFEHHARYMLDAGWDGNELYSISFKDPISDHSEMREELEAFVSNVRAESGAEEVSIVAHSLGVTGGRYWMDELDRYDWVDTFVGLNGANHGVCACPGCYEASLGDDLNNWMEAGEVCQFIAVQCYFDDDHPLYQLNQPTETPGDVEYHTYRGFFDPLFFCDPWSPYLEGADNNLYYSNHKASLELDQIASDVDDWCRADDSTDGGQPTVVNVVDADDYGDTVWKATFKKGCTDKDLEVALTNPSGEVADDDTVYDFDVDDSDHTVTLQMNEYDGVAEPGTWQLDVTYDDTGDQFYHTEKSFGTNGITLTDSRYWIEGDSDDAEITEWEFEFHNDGDLPLYVTRIEVEVDYDTEYLYPDRTLRPDETDTYRETDVGSDLGREFDQNYDVSLEVEVNDEPFATATDTVYPNGKIAVVDRHFDAVGSDHDNMNDEYVVFENVGDGTLDLEGWIVQDEAGYTYGFPDGFTLAPRDQVTLHTGSGTDTATDLYWGASSPIWNNSGDTVYVVDDAGEQRLPDTSGQVAVTNVHADAEGSDYDNMNDEYVDFENTSGGSLDMTGWTVEDEAGNTYAFPDGWSWSDGDAVRLHSGSGTDSASDLYWGESSPVWNNSGDTVFVYDDEGNKVVQHTY